MNRDQDVAVSQLARVALRLELGHSHAHERARDSAEGRSDGGSTQQRHDRSRRDEGSNAGNRNGPDAREPTERPAHDPPCEGPTRCADR